MTASYRPPAATQSRSDRGWWPRLPALEERPRPPTYAARTTFTAVNESPEHRAEVVGGGAAPVRRKPSSQVGLNVNVAFAMNLAGNATEPTIRLTTTHPSSSGWAGPRSRRGGTP